MLFPVGVSTYQDGLEHLCPSSNGQDFVLGGDCQDCLCTFCLSDTFIAKHGIVLMIANCQRTVDENAGR